MDFKGLNSQQVEASIREHGRNVIPAKEEETLLQKYLNSFKEKLTIILMVCLGLNVVFYFMGRTSILECLGIFVVILATTFISVYSEYKNANNFKALQEEASRIKCKVYRDGHLIELLQTEIVVGDIVVLQSGDKVPAECILLEGKLKVDQSALNGESLEATKLVCPNEDRGDINDLLNKYYVYQGTVVCNGNAVAEVIAIGENTEYGKIAKAMQDDTRLSPLKVKLGKLADQISVFGYVGGVAIALAFIVQSLYFEAGSFSAIPTLFSDLPLVFETIVDAIMLAVIIIVMAVPEGLPMMIALVLAMNMKKMINHNVLVKKNDAMDTTGSLSLVFSDKTGTLTYGKFQVTEIVDGGSYIVSDILQTEESYSNALINSMGVNNEAIFGEGEAVGGNSTDRALLNYLNEVHALETVDKSTIIASQPFDSAKKYSTTTVKVEGETCKYVKGAPELILSKCSTYLSKSGDIVPLDLAVLNAYMDLQASKCMRLIAVALTTNVESEELEEGMVLLGIISIRDNTRPEVAGTIEEMNQAGVQVVMATGDRKETAIAIAKEIGLIKTDSDIALTSFELAEMSDEEVKAIIPNLRVVARANPMDKLRLVTLSQELNYVVGMTGDGVNDSPALKKADVGFAMGSGTSVAKEAGDIVIIDDNLSSIENAILYGRTIFNNIRKFIIFQLTVNVSAVLLSFIGPLIGIHEPLTVIQILWINTVMDTLSALAFGNEPALKRYMQDKPVDRNASIVSKQMVGGVLSAGLTIFVGSLAILLCQPLQNLLGVTSDLEIRTAMFAFFMFAVIVNGFNARSNTVHVLEHITENKNFLIVMGLVAVIQIIIMYFCSALFSVVPLPLIVLAKCFIMSLIVLPIDMARKLIMK